MARSSSSLKRLRGLISTTTSITTHLLPPPPPPPPPLLFVKSYSDESTRQSRYNMVSTYGFWSPPDCTGYLQGQDFKHWFIIMDSRLTPNLSNEQLINFYVQTLAKVLDSVEEANEKIYKVTLDPRRDLGFGCLVNWEIAFKLYNLPEVAYTIPDSYWGNKDYGGLPFVKGKIVERGDHSKISETRTEGDNH